MAILFPLRNVRSKYECAHTMQVGMVLDWLSGHTYTIYIFSDKHTSTHEAIQISPPNLSEGGSLHSPITPHRQVNRGFVIGLKCPCVYIYVCVCTKSQELGEFVVVDFFLK